MKTDTHIPTLDGVRGLAALLVLFSHMHAVHLPQFVSPRIGDYGVILFFVLSGFLMGHLYLARAATSETITSYAVARIARVLPLYWCVGLLAFAISRWIDPGFIYHTDGISLLRLFTLTSIEAVFWSVGPEFQFYFLFPLIWLAFKAPTKIRPAALALVAGCLALAVFFGRDAPGFTVFSKLHIFLAGIAIAIVRGRLSADTANRLAIPVQIVALIALSLIVVAPPGVNALLYPSTAGDPKHIGYYGDPLKLLLCMTIVAAAALPSRAVNLLLANEAMRRIGAASFSLYLIHLPVLYVAMQAGIATLLPAYAALCALAALAIAASLACHLCIERPLSAATRRFLQRLANAAPFLQARRPASL